MIDIYSFIKAALLKSKENLLEGFYAKSSDATPKQIF